jgi:hypothetical protein
MIVVCANVDKKIFPQDFSERFDSFIVVEVKLLEV